MGESGRLPSRFATAFCLPFPAAVAPSSPLVDSECPLWYNFGMILYSFKNLEQLTRAKSNNAYRSAVPLLQFAPTEGDRAAVRFRGLRNATIDGAGATLRLDGRGYYFVLEACERVVLENFVLETAHPEYLEFTVLNSGFTGAEVRLNAEYDTSLDGNALSVKSGKTELIAPVTKAAVYCRNLDDDKITRESSDPVSRLKGASNIANAGGSTIAKLSFSGLSAVRKDCVYIRFDADKTCPGILLINCKDITIRNVTIRYSHGSAIKADMCENVTVQDVTLRAQTGRSVATLGSAFEAVECTGSLYIADCMLAATLADTVSVKGALYPIVSASGNSFRLGACDASALPPFEKGDVAALVDSSLSPVATATVTDYDKDTHTVVLDAPVPSGAGLRAENTSLHTADVFFRKTTLYGSPDSGLAFATSGFVRADYCTFKNIVGKAVVCKSGKDDNAGLPKRVEIEGNVFEQCPGTAIELLPSCSGSACVGDVDIYGNKLLECGKTAIVASRCRSVSVKRNVGDTEKYQTKISQCPSTDSDGVGYMY